MTYKKNSLYTMLGIIIVTVVMVAMLINSFISYQATKNRVIANTKHHSSKTIKSLNNNVSKYIESYSVNEYTNLVLSEMEYIDFQAIIVRDYIMGKILGGDVYVSGKIRDAAGKVIEYDQENEEMNKRLSDSFLTFTSRMMSASGVELGDITIYSSGHIVKKELREIIIENLILTVYISVTLILLLFFTIHRAILKPITELANTLSRIDADGIPISEIPLQGSLEIKVLSTSIISMITTIKKSKLNLDEKHRMLLHAEKLSSVGRLAASIAHEFNNPLCGVMNVIGGIKKRAVLSDNDQKLAAMALKECDRIKNLITNLQQFNKPSTGQRVLININKSIDEVLLLARKELKNQKASIETNFSTELQEIWVVPDQIKQVLINLIGNAGDAIGEEGGLITIDTVPSGKGSVSISIKDTGEGISPENIQHIFEPFYTTKAI